MRRLRDILTAHPRLLFMGINPSLRSAEVGHHFAGRGNPFWRLLYEARLVPVRLTYAEEDRLRDFGLALVSLCPRPTRTAAELRPEEIERGIRTVRRKIARLRPTVVAFVGVGIYRGFFLAGQARPGRGPSRRRFPGPRSSCSPIRAGSTRAFPASRISSSGSSGSANSSTR